MFTHLSMKSTVGLGSELVLWNGWAGVVIVQSLLSQEIENQEPACTQLHLEEK